MTKQCCFIGHRRIYDKSLYNKLKNTIITQIQQGRKSFLMGNHGDFDAMALHCCEELKTIYHDLKFTVVISSLSELTTIILKDDFGEYSLKKYDGIETIMYNIEKIHFKRKITESNKKMIDSCDTIICYVDNIIYNSGAMQALKYATKKGLKIINLCY